MKHFLLTGLTAVLLIPGTVHAYTEPEDVLFGDDTVIDTPSSSASSKSSAAVSSDGGLHSAAPTEPTGLTPREERILERVGNRINSPTPTGYVPEEEVLHSGAPLTHSGPESTIALAVLLVAMATTLVLARTGRIDFSDK